MKLKLDSAPGGKLEPALCCFEVVLKLGLGVGFDGYTKSGLRVI